MSVDEKQIKVVDRPTSHAWILGIVGALIGGIVGWALFRFLIGQGLYALTLPGAAIGLGFGTLSRTSMIWGGVFCAIVALPVMLFCEWQQFPFTEDNSFAWFLTHVHQFDSVMTYVFLALGMVFAFWFGRGR